MKKAEIPLSNGGVAVVDECEVHWLSRFTWRRTDLGSVDYAVTTIGTKKTTIQMHRLIVGSTPYGMTIDHADRDGLNNTRANLRICHYTQNSQNTRKSFGKGTSRFKGVQKGRIGWWRSYIRADGKQHYLGEFRTEEDAARAYDAAARKWHGEFACTNEDMNLY